MENVEDGCQMNESNHIDRCKEKIGDFDFLLWKKNLSKDLPEFWQSIHDGNKKLVIQCLLSLWLFTFFVETIFDLLPL